MPHLRPLKSAVQSLSPYRAVAPWIAGFEEPLQFLLDKAGDADDAGVWAGTAAANLVAARRQASFQRWQQGPEEWRHWVREVRSLQSELALDPSGRRLLAWLTFADFCHQAFVRPAEFVGVEFPAGVSFAGAQFCADAWFSGSRFNGRADFSGTRFAQDCFFEQSWFKAQAHFDKAAFAGSARFSAVIALSGFFACKTQFESDLWMRSSQLFGPLNFAQSQMMGEAGFGNCNFQDVDFSQTDFYDNAGFEDSVFVGDANFEHACFSRNARFERTQFATQPRFKAARFFHACHFDDAMVPLIQSPAAACREEIERRLQS
jgi:uncharacterized protein YjbI with pentapeptide repeats